MKNNKILAITLSCALLLLTIDTKAAETKDKPWKNETGISYVSTNGNTKANTFSAKELFTYNWTKWVGELFGGALTAEDKGSKTAEKFHAGEKLSYKLSDHDYFYEQGRWDKDRFAGIRHRYDLGLGYGRILIKDDHHLLKGEVGGGYISEERIGEPRNDFSNGRVYGKYELTLSETASFQQDAEYLHNFEDKADYRVNAETALLSKLSTYLSLKISYDFSYVGQPPKGFGKTDTITLVSLIFNY